MKKLLIAAAVAVVATVAVASEVRCMLDGSNTYFTGETKNDGLTGKLLQKYVCMLYPGHVYWVPAN